MELRATAFSPAAFANRAASSTARATGNGSRLDIHCSTAWAIIASRSGSSRWLPTAEPRLRGRNANNVGFIR
jgi:hypothetical protein